MNGEIKSEIGGQTEYNLGIMLGRCEYMGTDYRLPNSCM